jgi:prefoldin subunit 5
MERLRSKMENLNQKKDKLEESLTETRTEKEKLTKKSEKLKAENATFEWDALKSTDKFEQAR